MIVIALNGTGRFLFYLKKLPEHVTKQSKNQWSQDRNENLNQIKSKTLKSPRRYSEKFKTMK